MAQVKGRIKGKINYTTRKQEIDIIEVGCDFYKLYEEYEKLREYKYQFLLENDEYINVLFEPENFLHLTGFNKIEDSTIIALIDNDILGPKDFYDFISERWLNYDYFNEEEILTEKIKKKADNHSFDYSKVKVIKESELKSKLRGVLRNRIAFFNEDTIMSVFGNKVVIDFNKEKCISDIEANKVFFRMLDNTDGHNINLFVKYDEKENKGYPITFFREDEQGYFLKIREERIVEDINGRKSKKVTVTGKANQYNVLVKMRINKHTERQSEVYINWEKIRWQLRNEEGYITQTYLKDNNYFKSNCITSNMLLEGIYKIDKAIAINISKINLLKKELGLINNFEIYTNSTNEEEKNYLLEGFMEQGIFIDEDESIERLSNRLVVEKDIEDINKKMKQLIKTIDLYKKSLLNIREQEMKEVRYIYSKLLDTNTEALKNEGFIRELIDAGCYENELTLDEIKSRAEKIDSNA